MENCEHQLRIDLFPQGSGATQKHFWVAKCQKCNNIFSVTPADNMENLFKSFLNDMMAIKNTLSAISSYLENISKRT